MSCGKLGMLFADVTMTALIIKNIERTNLMDLSF